MKVLKPGVVFFDGSTLHVSRWEMDAEGEVFASEEQALQAVTRCALAFVAERRGLSIASVSQPSAECVAADAIRKAKGVS